MMNFLILALLALSAGFSESKTLSKDPGQNEEVVREVLKEYYKITAEDLSAKCDKVNDKTRWDSVVKTFLSFQNVAQGILTDVEKEAKKSKKATDDVYDDLFKTHCLNNDAVKNSKTNVIKTALPCVTKEKLAEILEFTVSYSCEEMKKEAKKKNQSG